MVPVRSPRPRPPRWNDAHARQTNASSTWISAVRGGCLRPDAAHAKETVRHRRPDGRRRGRGAERIRFVQNNPTLNPVLGASTVEVAVGESIACPDLAARESHGGGVAGGDCGVVG